jgi:hypothetical protein
MMGAFFTSPRHAELVSASMPHSWGKTVGIQILTAIEAWTLKQVQGDGVANG